MLELIGVQKLKSPASVIRFSPDGTMLLTCSALVDEVTVWRSETLPHLSPLAVFATGRSQGGEFTEHIRDACWLTRDRILLTGLLRPLQVWSGITTSTPRVELDGFALDSSESPEGALNIIHQADRFVYMSLTRSGVTGFDSGNLSITARDALGSGQAHVASFPPLVSGVFADQASTTLMFGELMPSSPSVDWFPLRIIQPGEVFGGVLSAPEQRASAMLHGEQGATITVLGLPHLNAISVVDITAESEAGTVHPDEYCDYLVESESLICKPLLHCCHLIYPGLSGRLVCVANLFGDSIVFPYAKHTAAITSMSVYCNTLAVSSFDSTISFWDLSRLGQPTISQGQDNIMASFRELIRDLRHQFSALVGRDVFVKNVGQNHWSLAKE